jgi:NSS family neurotransmitter:Na+ symporter
MLGMAVGTGNIWRFPREAANNGGGSFLIAWVVFLLLWSVPLLMVEFAMGRASRRGPIGAFAVLFGRGRAWMGAWVAFCATAIMFYYSVVMGWTLRYLWSSISQGVPMTSPEAATAFWEGFVGTPTAVVFHALAMALGVVVVARGIGGIEKAVRWLIPALFVLVIALAIRAVTLPGAGAGLAFLFTPDMAELKDPGIWIAALTQNAWDTGAGWGLALAYAVYLRESEDTALNAFVLGFGNNTVSLLAGVMVLCTVFAIMPEASGTIIGAGNEGLTFIWVPQLFGQMPGGSVFMVLFFLALFIAAWSSLIAMIELATRVLIDAGLARGRAILIVGAAGFLLGLPSALSLPFFRNQDWVWGVGLMLSGFFFAYGVIRYGVDRFRTGLVNQAGSDITIGRWWNWAMRFVLVEAVVLTIWWLWQAVQAEDLAATLTPFSSFNVGTVMVQWGVVIVVLLALNRFFAARMSGAMWDSDEP